MTLLLQYIIRMSICLSLMYLFYRLVLRKFTFYQHNRLYLIGYSAGSFILPVIDIARLYPREDPSHVTDFQSSIISTIPQVDFFAGTATSYSERSVLDYSTVIIWIIFIGISCIFIRLLIQIAAIQKLKRTSRLVTQSRQFKRYQVDDNIAPFSFGKSIFINERNHTEDEIEKILIHEIAHVRQNHTLDILWAELMVATNWFNPFAWKLRKAIKENIEYIADELVLQSGINKQQYQYLLLHVSGNSPFEPTSPFNFSSLKNRIIMMNKSKTARIQLLKFLFLLPLLSVLLISFRGAVSQHTANIQFYGTIMNDVTHQPLANALLVDAENNISALTNNKGHYDFNLTYPSSIKLPIKLSVQKEGFNKTTLLLKTLENNNGQKNSIFMMNAGLLPKGSNNLRPATVIIGSRQSAKNYDALIQSRDNMVDGDPLLTKDSVNPALNMAGIVVNSETYEPLSDVIIKNTDNQLMGQTDEKGFYSIQVRPAPGTINDYHLIFVKQGYTQLQVKSSHKINLPKGNIIDNVGMTDENNKKKDNKEPFISFTQTKSQSSTITYEDAYKLLTDHNEKAKIAKRNKTR